MKFYKYTALGNDYLVIDDPEFIAAENLTGRVRALCDRRFGIGSDGVLFGPEPGKKDLFELRIFNPDGSEAEKSGNGLRIFARFLVDSGYSNSNTFPVKTRGGMVSCEVSDDRRTVAVSMGQVSFDSRRIPVVGPDREVLREKISVGGREFEYCAATVGNPHCVILLDETSPELAREYGSLIENEERFVNRTNVQFLQVLDRNTIRIEIWERGAGYTLASGSSSTAAAAVAHKLGLCDKNIIVKMAGGEIKIELDEQFFAIMKGGVTRVCSGEIDSELY